MDPDEAVRRAGRHAVLSHESAARLHGIDLLERGPETVTVPRNRSRLELPDWTVVRADVPRADRCLVSGVPVTSVLRTIWDLARHRPLDGAVVAADSAVRRGLVEASDLQTRLLATVGRGAGNARATGRLLDPLSESVLESLLRLLLVGAGLTPLSQHPILDRHGWLVARVDFCWPERRLVVEADGFAFHADRAAYRRDRERLNQLERLGWRVLRFTWEDVRRRPEHVVALVHECLAATA